MKQEITNLKALITGLEEYEAKSLLFQILLKVDRQHELDNSELELVKDVQEMFHSLLEATKLKTSSENYTVVHIAFGYSAAGGLKEARKQHTEKVICVPDMLSVGPLTQLDKEPGVSARYEWLKHHILFEHEEEILSEQARLNEAIAEIKAIPEEIPIWIWSGDNSHEQTGERLALFLLKGKKNPIRVLNTAKDFKEIFPAKATKGYPRHTGELLFEQLSAIYESNHSSQPLSEKARNGLENEWSVLSSAKGFLRIWQDGKIKSVREDYFDDHILHTVRRLESRGDQGFIKAARVIGELIGGIEQHLGDTFYEYRLRHLIMDGHLEIYGVPRAMRFYSVRVRKGAIR